MDRRAAAAIVALVTVAVIAVVAIQTGFWVNILDPGEYDRRTVTVVDDNGTTVATVSVRIANTSSQRTVGLSETESLGENEGMLFVHETEETQNYVMRNMDFPLDIIFVADNGTITTIHHAPVPLPGTSESELERYSGTARYVLEVERGWANETGLKPGDRVVVPREFA